MARINGYLLVLTIIFISSCAVNGSDDLEVIEDKDCPSLSCYKMSFGSIIGNVELLGGTETYWSPGIGRLELGPEDGRCGSGSENPVASLWVMGDPLTFNPDQNDFDFQITTSSFYSILYPCNDLGEQEANWYSLVSVEDKFIEIGKTSEGLV